MSEEIDNKEDEIEVLVDDTPAEGTTEVETPAAKEPEDWKAQFEAAKKRADEAEAKAAEIEAKRTAEAERHMREVAESRKVTVSAEMTAVTNALANLEHAKANAKAEYSKAMQEGDFDAAAEAQLKMSEISVKHQRISEGKAALERRAEVQADPVEQWVSQLQPKSAAWIRAHPNMVKTPDAQKKLEQAHYLALGNGHMADTDGYFDYIEKHFDLKPKNEDPIVETTASKTEARTSETRQQSTPVAPPSREGSSGAPTTSRTTIRLTAAQREIAAACGMSDAEYAKNLLAIERETRH